MNHVIVKEYYSETTFLFLYIALAGKLFSNKVILQNMPLLGNIVS